MFKAKSLEKFNFLAFLFFIIIIIFFLIEHVADVYTALQVSRVDFSFFFFFLTNPQPECESTFFFFFLGVPRKTHSVKINTVLPANFHSGGLIILHWFETETR